MQRTEHHKKENCTIRWMEKPEQHDYPAALSYLTLLLDETLAQQIVENFPDQPVQEFKAKDIFRASELSLLGVSNSHVERDRLKIKQGIALSPLLLVKDTQRHQLIIADGYHRLCAVYEYQEDALIPCQLMSI